MQQPPFRKARATLLIAPLLFALGCNAASGPTPAALQPEQMTLQQDVIYGSGPFSLPDPNVGLSDVSSYRATLTLSFDGTRNGQPEKWSKTYLMLSQRDPAARQLTIETSGDLADLDPVFTAEAAGTAYERIGEHVCSATQLEAGKSLADRMEPARLLNYVVGAEAAGSETIDDIAANHYTFDQRALGQQAPTEATGEVWVASEGGYILKYVLSTKGGADYFGEGIEGTLSYDYLLTQVNQPVEFSLPSDCPLGLVEAPQLPDASNVRNVPGVLSYDTSSSAQDAAAFYQQELPNLGWEVFGEQSVTDATALLGFTRDDQTMTLIISANNGITTIQIALGRSQK